MLDTVTIEHLSVKGLPRSPNEDVGDTLKVTVRASQLVQRVCYYEFVSWEHMRSRVSIG